MRNVAVYWHVVMECIVLFSLILLCYFVFCMRQEWMECMVRIAAVLYRKDTNNGSVARALARFMVEVTKIYVFFILSHQGLDTVCTPQIPISSSSS